LEAAERSQYIKAKRLAAAALILTRKLLRPELLKTKSPANSLRREKSFKRKIVTTATRK
jgi:hypothetical protein